jgi:hypothetical protein
MKESIYGDKVFLFYLPWDNCLYVESRDVNFIGILKIVYNEKILYASNECLFSNNINYYIPNINLSDYNEFNVIMEDYDKIIHIERTIKNNKKALVFENTDNYLSGAHLGDFIYQLSVIKENYIKTGRKANLYLNFNTEIYPGKNHYIVHNASFVYGVEQAYEDLKDIILLQDYINSFLIYQGEELGQYTNLSEWRASDILNIENTKTLFSETYNVEWASHKWLDLPIKSEYNEMILISNTLAKYNYDFDYNKLKQFNMPIFFATTDIKEYDEFKKIIGYDCNVIVFKNLMELWIAINSCNLFVCGFGSFLATANALYHKTIALHPQNSNDGLYYPKDLINMNWYFNKKNNNINI